MMSEDSLSLVLAQCMKFCDPEKRHSLHLRKSPACHPKLFQLPLSATYDFVSDGPLDDGNFEYRNDVH